MTILITLSTPGLADLVLNAEPYAIGDYDLGHPLPREVSEDAPDANGKIDTSALEAERIITVKLSQYPWTWAETQALKAFTRQDLRATMTITQTGAPDLIATVRTSQFSQPVSTSHQVALAREPVLQWIAPSGILESAVLHEETVIPDAGATSGLEFGTTLEFGPTLEFPLVEPAGTQEIVNAGDRDAYPVVRAFGPFGDEGNAADETEIGNVTSGKSLVFAGMGIAAGDYLEIDFRRKTILVNGLKAQSRYQYLSFPDSEWWTLTPGINEITFRPDTFTGNAQMSIRHRDAYS